jgi:soluble lytic murein transglycosylase-like protein
VKTALTTRLARARKRADNSRTYRLLGARGTAALLMGAALSVGGLTQALDGAHFVVEKDLDSVQVVKQQGKRATVVADVHDSFAANSLFKLSRVLPESLVSQRIALFDDAWLPKTATDTLAQFTAPHVKRDVFHEEMARINDAIRGQFFAHAMPYGDIIHEKSVKYDVDPALVAAVIEQESKFHRTAHSPVGARGLMQLMPRTGRWLGARNLYDPEQNVDAGVKYIKYLQSRFDGNVKKTIAAYNAGEGNVRRYNGIPPFRETQTYVKRVMSNYQKRNDQLRDFSAEHAGVADDGVRTLR